MQWQKFLSVLLPFAPHIASELGEAAGIDLSVWPQVDASKLVGGTVTLGVQVNGKLRGSIELAPTASEAEAVAAAHATPAVAKWLAGGIKKVIYVPGKILSLTTDLTPSTTL